MPHRALYSSIRRLFLINNGLIEVHELQHYQDIIDLIVKQTEKTLTSTT
jgi:hypothetical protein